MMLDVDAEFDLPDDRVWLNAAHQGPLPRSAADAVAEMIEWKAKPHHLQHHDAFSQMIDRLRAITARLVEAEASEIVLANSASYGLHLLATGLVLAEGDEVVVMANDFPSDILPWIHRQRQTGIVVKAIEPEAAIVSADEVASSLSRRTKVVCLPWVHSFSGQMVDLDAIGEICRRWDALFVVNGSQGIGAVPMSVRQHPVDALISVGFKWLCGPYGTGFAWLGPRAMERLRPTKLYWLNALTTEDLEGGDIDPTGVLPVAPGCFDIFAAANFFNSAGLLEAIELIRRVGVARIRRHDLDLASQLVDRVDAVAYEVQDRGPADRHSSMVLLRPVAESLTAVASRLRVAKIDVAVRAGMIRLSPHLYNTSADVDRTVEALRTPADRSSARR